MRKREQSNNYPNSTANWTIIFEVYKIETARNLISSALCNIESA